jgi:hypothetical protein
VEKRFGRIGFLLDGGFSTPVHRRFFADLQVQYVHVGREEFGSHTLTGSVFSGNPVTKTADFTKTSFAISSLAWE